MKIHSVIFAAESGKRMQSKTHKLLHLLCGKPVIDHFKDTLKGAAITTTVIASESTGKELGHLSSEFDYVTSDAKLSLGQALLQIRARLEYEGGALLIARGDTPLLTQDTIHEMIRLHEQHHAGATLLTVMKDQPNDEHEAVIRNELGSIVAVRKQERAPVNNTTQEIHAGVLLVDSGKLFKALDFANQKNKQQAYHLSDIVALLHGQGERIESYTAPDTAEAIIIHDRLDLAEAEKKLRERITRTHMLNGVTIIDPSTTYIGPDVKISRDTTILPGCLLKGNTHIGEDCIIGPYSDITDSTIGAGVEIKQSVLSEAEVGERSHIGPFAYLRPGSKLGSEVKVGDFVEIKNASLGDKTKVSHLSYIGDASVGEDVNIGCGAVTVNYDGYRKHRTEIGDFAFVGSNVNLVAPVKIGRGAFVVAGSTITSSVEDGDVAIARERQVNKPGYADKLRKKLKAQSDKNSN